MYNHTGINKKGPRIEPCGTPFDNGDVVFLFSEAEGTQGAKEISLPCSD